MCDEPSPDWLPPLVTIDEYGGDWHRYLDGLYGIFKNEFLETPVIIDLKPLFVRRHPTFDGKLGSFWHLLGHEDGQAVPVDFRRHERIRWPKAIILHRGDSSIKAWSDHDFKGGNPAHERMCLWFNDEYLVVLEERERYVSLVTAYPTDRGHTRRKLQARFEAAQKAETADN